MKVSTTIYNAAGELMAPRATDVKLNRPFPGGRPEKEPGYYYAFKFEGRTPQERAAKRERFFAEMNATAGFLALAVREYRVKLDTFERYGVEVLYAVEGARPIGRAATDVPRSTSPSMLAVIRGEHL